jgi:hypothetical protein
MVLRGGSRVGSIYEFKVRAFNAAGSNESEVLVFDTTPPSAPSNVRFPAVGSTSVRITWTDNSNNEDGFKINYEGESTSVGTNDTDTTIGFLSAGTEYCFTVHAFNEYGTSSAARNCVRTTTGTPQVGVRQLEVFNCHNDRRTVHLWTRDATAGES